MVQNGELELHQRSVCDLHIKIEERSKHASLASKMVLAQHFCKVNLWRLVKGTAKPNTPVDWLDSLIV
jgi:hypothetical protein